MHAHPHPSMSLRLARLLVPMFVPGCFAVTNIDRFQEAAPKPNEDLTFTLRAATSHVGQYFEFRLVDANNFIQLRGVIDPLPAPDATVHVPSAVPRQNGPYRLDFFCDKRGLREYRGLGDDNTQAHAWRVEPLADLPAPGNPNDGVLDVTYDHNTLFTDLDEYPVGQTNPAREPGHLARIRLLNAQAFVGKLVQIRIREKPSTRTVGLYRFSSLAQPEAEAILRGVVDDDVDYDVEVYVDGNGNGAYEKPQPGGAGDFGFRISATSAGGLDVVFDPESLDGTVDLGAP